MASHSDAAVTLPKSNADEKKRRQDRKRRWLAEQEKRTRERIDRELGNL